MTRGALSPLWSACQKGQRRTVTLKIRVSILSSFIILREIFTKLLNLL